MKRRINSKAPGRLEVRVDRGVAPKSSTLNPGVICGGALIECKLKISVTTNEGPQMQRAVLLRRST